MSKLRNDRREETSQRSRYTQRSVESVDERSEDLVTDSSSR